MAAARRHLDAGRLERVVLEREPQPRVVDLGEVLVDLDLLPRLLDDVAHRVGEEVQLQTPDEERATHK